MVSDATAARLREHLVRLYGEGRAGATMQRLVQLLEGFSSAASQHSARLFDETDVVLIAYGDQVQEPGEAPLSTLRSFLGRHTRGVVSGLHLLPHCGRRLVEGGLLVRCQLDLDAPLESASPEDHGDPDEEVLLAILALQVGRTREDAPPVEQDRLDHLEDRRRRGVER